MNYYEATAQRDAPGSPLRGAAKTDVAIIGAGYTGLMAALTLAERGVSVRVIEAGLIGQGASGRNGGQLATGQRRSQRWLEAHYGEERARRLWHIASEAKALVFRRIAQHHIACDVKPGVITAAHQADLLPGLLADAEHLKSHYGYNKIEPLNEQELGGILKSKAYHGGLLDRGAAHLHPLRYALGLARAARSAGAVIHENSRAVTVDTERAFIKTEEGILQAEHLILACNGYLDDIVRPLATHIMPINNFMIATAPLGALAKEVIAEDFAVADTRFVIRYFRLSSDGRLIFGGGESYGTHLPGDMRSVVRPHMLKLFPALKDVALDYAWGGTLAITLNRMPHVGRLGRTYFAQGYSGQGLAMGGMAGQLLADAILGKTEDFNALAGLEIPAFPGGLFLRNPIRVAAMIYGTLKDAS